MDKNDKEYIKEQIKEIIDSVDDEDMLVYLNRLISNIVKAGH